MITSELLTQTFLLTEAATRRYPVLDSGDRRQLQLRSLVFASAGLPIEVAVVDTMNRARSLTRRQVAPRPTIGELGFQQTVHRIHSELAAAAESATAQIEAAEESVKRAKAETKQQEEAIKVAKDQAEQLGQCAEAIEGVMREE